MPAARLAVMMAAACWLLAAMAGVVVGQQFRTVPGLRMTAFPTITWDGTPFQTGVDATLSNELLGQPPFPDRLAYSIEWTGALAIRDAGTYRFWLTSDDGSTLEIDGALVVDDGGAHRAQQRDAEVVLAEGIHPMRVRYFQSGGHYTMSLLWARAGHHAGPIPAAALTSDVPSYTTYQWRAVAPVAVALAVFGALACVCRALRPLLMRLAHDLAAFGSPAVRALERPAVALAVVVVIGALLRLAVFLTTPAIVWPDSHVFYITAHDIVEGAWRSHDSYRTAIYPFFLASFLTWSDSPGVGAVILMTQLELGVLTAVFVYLIARRAFTPLVALAGALAFAVHPLQVFYEMAVLTEALFTLVLMVTLWLSLRAYEAPSVTRVAALAVSAITLVLVRPVAQWFVVPLLVAGVMAVPRSRVGWRAALAGGLCYLVPLAGWMAVNQAEYGFFGVALGRGMGLYTRVFEIDGLEPPSPSADPEMRELWSMARMARWSPNRVRDELNFVRRIPAVQADERMYRFALETVRADPFTYAAGSVRQWLVQIAAPATGVRTCDTARGAVLCSGRDDGPLTAFPTAPPPAAAWLRRLVVSYVTNPIAGVPAVAVLAAVGVVAALWRQGGAVMWLLALTTIYFTAVPALTQWPQDRFRLPVDALLFLFAIWGARALARRWPPIAHG